MFRVTSRGSFNKIENFLHHMLHGSIFDSLSRGGQMGVEALRDATPVRTGRTGDLWGYEVGKENGIYFINWINTNVNDGVNIAVILQYGHGTGTGGFVQGIDYVNPVMDGVFNEIADDIWKEVKGG